MLFLEAANFSLKLIVPNDWLSSSTGILVTLAEMLLFGGNVTTWLRPTYPRLYERPGYFKVKFEIKIFFLFVILFAL